MAVSVTLISNHSEAHKKVGIYEIDMGGGNIYEFQPRVLEWLDYWSWAPISMTSATSNSSGAVITRSSNTFTVIAPNGTIASRGVIFDVFDGSDKFYFTAYGR
mgnify:CR=1 FL=1